MNRLKELRKTKAIKQAQLARMLGVAQSTMSGWENGINEIDIDSLFKLADFFGVSVDYLLGRDPSENMESDLVDDMAYSELLSEAKDLPDEDVQQLINMARFLKSQKK